jgi:hypothetical protein
MTVHWNSRKGFVAGADTSSTADQTGHDEESRALMAELLLAMRKAPDLRNAVVNRGKKLMANPAYPTDEIVKAVADVLARKLKKPKR